MVSATNERPFNRKKNPEIWSGENYLIQIDIHCEIKAKILPRYCKSENKITTGRFQSGAVGYNVLQYLCNIFNVSIDG